MANRISRGKSHYCQIEQMLANPAVESSSIAAKNAENKLPKFQADEEVHAGFLRSLGSYPKGVFFMLGNEFCERFSYYGMQAILTIYLSTEHHLSDSATKQIFHAFISLAYFSSIFGSILADNFFGRFRVILWVSLVYVFGHVLLSAGAIPLLVPTLKSCLDFSGLIVIALATGGIKPCVSAFAADQFGNGQSRERSQFFSFFYMAINSGSLIAIAVTPLFRNVRCLHSDHCFPLAFGVPGLLMLLSFFSFLAGWRFYKIAPAAEGNVLWKLVRCIGHGLRMKMRRNKVRNERQTDSHWLDCAVPKYGHQLVAGAKSILAIIGLYVPIALFWSLSEQQGSTWVLQGTKMNGRVGWFTILPDQVHTLNPLLILLLVPIFEAWIYPLASRLCKVTALRKMALGGILAAIAYCMAGFLQMQINGTMEPKPAEGNVLLFRIGNATGEFVDRDEGIRIPAKSGKFEIPARNYTFQSNGTGWEFELALAGREPRNYVLGLFEREGKLIVQKFPYSGGKSADGKTRFYFLLEADSPLNGTEAWAADENGQKVSSAPIANGNFLDIQPGFFSRSPNYRIFFGNCGGREWQGPVAMCNQQRHFDVQVQMGAASVLDLIGQGQSSQQLVRPNSISIAWQFPQVVVITVGEVLLSITGLEFSYSQAPASMKSVLQALWLQAVFVGNLLDIFISRMEIPDPVTEFFVYAALMFGVMAIFVVLAMRYRYVDENSPTENEESERVRSHWLEAKKN